MHFVVQNFSSIAIYSLQPVFRPKKRIGKIIVFFMLRFIWNLTGSPIKRSCSV